MKQEKKDINWVIANYMTFFTQFGMNEPNIRSEFERWKVKSISKSGNDYLWYIFNFLLNEVGKAHIPTELLYKHLRDINLEMAMFLRKVEYKPGNVEWREMLKYSIELQAYQSPYKLNVKCVSNGCCGYCTTLDQKEFTVDYILKHEPLANSDKCTREWGCNCRYTFVPVQDKNGRLIEI